MRGYEIMVINYKIFSNATILSENVTIFTVPGLQHKGQEGERRRKPSLMPSLMPA